MTSFKFHHHHTHRSLDADALSVPLVKASSVISIPDPSAATLKRRETCSSNSNSSECETPVHTNGLAIGLGVGIPFLLAISVLVYLHFRHVGKLKKEDLDNKDLDLDGEFFDPIMTRDFPHKTSDYTLNSKGENVPAKSSLASDSINMADMSLVDPFNHTPYKIPELNSSQRSLNNISMYDLGAYPPSGTIYDSPKYPASVYTRSSSPVSSGSNLHSQAIESHTPYGINPSQQVPNLSIHPLKMVDPKISIARAPYMNPSRASSTLSVVSSHTPTVQATFSHISVPTPTSATIGHSSNASMSSTESVSYSSDRQNTDITTPDSDDDSDDDMARHNRIEQKLEHEIRELEASADTTESPHGAYSFQDNYTKGASQISFDNDEHGKPIQRNSVVDFHQLELSDQRFGDNLNREHTKEQTDIGHTGLIHENSSFSPEVDNFEFPSRSDAASSEQYSQVEHNKQTDRNEVVRDQFNGHQIAREVQAREPVYQGGFDRSPDQKNVHVSSRQGPSTPKSTPLVPPRVEANFYHSPPSQVNATPKTVKPPKPLPKLSAIPTAHNVGETDFNFYAPQRRVQSPASPVVPGYNPLTSPITNDEKHMPSPSQLGSNSSVFSSTDFSLPKKFSGSGGNRSRSNSLADSYEHTSKSGSTPPRGGFRQQRPPTELVPDIKDQVEILKPNMNMR